MKALALLLALAAGPAQALSVVPSCGPDNRSVAAAFHQFDSFASPVVMALGTFSAGEMVNEAVYGANNQIADREYLGRFSGMSASSKGFSTGFSAPVSIMQHCENGSCFPRFDGTPYLVFLVKTSDGYRFVQDGFQCAPSGFAKPSKTDLAQALACLNGSCG